MALFHESSRVGWLRSLIGDKKSRIANLLGDIAALGPPGSMKPGIFRKFLELLSQVEREQDGEHDLIARIEDIENRHRFRREHGQLEHADPDFDFVGKLQAQHQGQENKKASKGLNWFFHLWDNPDGGPNPRKKKDLA